VIFKANGKFVDTSSWLSLHPENSRPTQKGHTGSITLSPARSKRNQGSAMTDLLGCRNMELLCRRRAVLDHEHSWKWLGEAERWKDLAHSEIACRFQKHPMNPGPMAMGPNTIDGDLHK
jgi:hypothetical protein